MLTLLTVIWSPIFTSVRNFVPEPVTVAEPDVTLTVPVALTGLIFSSQYAAASIKLWISSSLVDKPHPLTLVRKSRIHHAGLLEYSVV